MLSVMTLNTVRLCVITLNIVMQYSDTSPFSIPWYGPHSLYCICEKVGDTGAAAAASFLVIYKVRRILMRRLSPLDWDTCQIFSSRKQTLLDHRYKTFCARNLRAFVLG